MAEDREELQQLQPDFSEAVDFSPFPDSTFLCTIENITGFKSKGRDGKPQIPMVEVKFKIEDDKPYTTADGEVRSTKGRMLFRNFPCSGVGTGFLAGFLAALKYPTKSFRLPESKIELLGRKVYVATKLDSSMSPARNKAESFTPAK